VWVLQELGRALQTSFYMFWQVLWPLGLGFLLSAVVETVIARQTITGALGKDSVRGVALAAALGAASSSCSYAAVAIARTLFRKGATFANAIIFEFASTNLVFELGLVLLILLGWQFVGAELAGGLVMVVLLALAFRATMRPGLVDRARAQAARGLLGRMEGHAAMDMSVTDGPLLRRLVSPRAITSISHYFFMNVYSLWFDLLLGFLIAGALAAWVPDSFWSHLFLTGNGVGSEVWGAVIGPLVAMITFVCSVGNVPLAAVLWRGGISFSGVIAFIFADLVILPILNIYRRYYTASVSGYLLAVSLPTMAVAGLLIGLLFRALNAVPTSRNVTAFTAPISWNSDTILDIGFLLLIGLLLVRFLRTGGVMMLRQMNLPPDHRTAAHAEHHAG